MTLQAEGAREGEAGLIAVTYVLHSFMNGASDSLLEDGNQRSSEDKGPSQVTELGLEAKPLAMPLVPWIGAQGSSSQRRAMELGSQWLMTCCSSRREFCKPRGDQNLL